MSKALRLSAQRPLMVLTRKLSSTGRDKRSQDSCLIDHAPPVDSLLLPLLQAASEAEYEEWLAFLLVEYARPVIDAVIKRKLRVSLKETDGRSENQDALEFSGEVQMRLLGALRRLNERGGQPISDFQSYVAMTAHHACHEFLRRKYPQRHSLKNRLRYLIGHHASLALWESNGVVLCGMTAWRFQKKREVAGPQLRLRLNESKDGFKSPWPRASSRAPLQDLVIEIFRKIDAPVELNALVGVVADLLEIKEAYAATETLEEQDEREPLESLADESSNHHLKLEGRLYLERLWSEIYSLPSRQRAALLLNLRDAQGNAVIDLFPITGVATIRNLADAMEMPAEELAELWNELPLADDAIAVRLGLTRQQVINLRKSARQRLARRMKAQ